MEASTLAIECPGCGRAYDASRFPLGRTLHCTCGARVGLPRRLSIPEGEAGPRFIADAMLGRLARWLRTLGYDTAWDPGIADVDLVRRALGEGRHILTRDAGLRREWRVDVTLLEERKPVRQLAEVVETFDLPRPRRLFTRCRACNAGLEAVSLRDVAHRVPEDVATRLEAAPRDEAGDEDPTARGQDPTAGEEDPTARGEDPKARQEDPTPAREDGSIAVRETSTLARCPDCTRIYWEGSHTARMRAVVDGIFRRE